MVCRSFFFRSVFIPVSLFSIFCITERPVASFAAERPEEPPTLEPVVVTATRTEIPLKEAAASVTIVDAKKIEERRVTTVAEALRQTPGLTVVESGGPGGTTTVFLRGTNSNHALVLIDGVPVNSPATGAFDFANLTVDNIERIEVIHGPQSTLYGSDAIGGVIQIFTKKGKGPATPTLSFEGGSYRSFRETFGLSGSASRFDYSLSISRFDTKGFSRADARNGNSERDGYKNTTLSSRIGVHLTPHARLEWTARYTDAKSDIDGCVPVCPTDDPNFIQKDRSLTTSLAFLSEAGSWNQQLRYSFTNEKMKGLDPDPADLFNNFGFDTRGHRVDWRHRFDTGTPIRMTAGGEFEWQDRKGKGEGDDFNKHIHNVAPYLLGELRLLPFLFNLGGRIDDNSRFGSHSTGKAEAAYLFESTGTKLRGSYGTGFRGPTLNDLFFPNFGNPDLQPEKSKGAEIGLEQPLRNGNGGFRVTYFQNRIDNLIVNPVTFPGKPENVERATTKGWEIGATAPIGSRGQFSATYTLTDTENETTGKELARRPRHQASAALTLSPTDRLRGVVEVRYAGNRFDDTANTVRVDDYTVTRLAGSYLLTGGAELFARIENLFNRKYQETAGYGTLGRSVYGGLKLTF